MTRRFNFEIVEKEEYYQYHNNPETFVMGRSIFGINEKEEYYQYHDNPETFVTGRSNFGIDKKEKYYWYHNNWLTMTEGVEAICPEPPPLHMGLYHLHACGFSP